jgi:3-methylcrotonyl-CoA carboxylase alpha subunit
MNPLPLPAIAVAEQGSLRAPMTGQVISVLVETGQSVSSGDILLIIEAMKMEHRIEAPYDGRIEQLHYNVGDTVQQDAILLALKNDVEA